MLRLHQKFLSLEIQTLNPGKLLPGAADNSLASGACGALGRSGAFGALGGSRDYIGGGALPPRTPVFVFVWPYETERLGLIWKFFMIRATGFEKSNTGSPR